MEMLFYIIVPLVIIYMIYRHYQKKNTSNYTVIDFPVVEPAPEPIVEAAPEVVEPVVEVAPAPVAEPVAEAPVAASEAPAKPKRVRKKPEPKVG